MNLLGSMTSLRYYVLSPQGERGTARKNDSDKINTIKFSELGIPLSVNHSLLETK